MITMGSGGVAGRGLRAVRDSEYAAPFPHGRRVTATPFGGNPVAVVLDSDGLSTGDMQRFDHWTNLSETTFVFPPSG